MGSLCIEAECSKRMKLLITRIGGITCPSLTWFMGLREQQKLDLLAWLKRIEYASSDTWEPPPECLDEWARKLEETAGGVRSGKLVSDGSI
jgi:hypothetical protein